MTSGRLRPRKRDSRFDITSKLVQNLHNTRQIHHIRARPATSTADLRVSLTVRKPNLVLQTCRAAPPPSSSQSLLEKSPRLHQHSHRRQAGGLSAPPPNSSKRSCSRVHHTPDHGPVPTRGVSGTARGSRARSAADFTPTGERRHRSRASRPAGGGPASRKANLSGQRR